MADSETTLADRWLRAMKNNPVIAGMIVLGALIGILTPIWTSIGSRLTPPSKQLSQVDRAALMSDRDTILVPVRNALRENKVLYDKLSSSLYHEPGWGVQESYYERVKRDGPEKHELMRGIIDALVLNNKKILSALDTYVGRARTEALKEQEALFREHARLYESRWAGMKAAAVSGEMPPVAESVFPVQFPASLDAEIKKVQQIITAGQ